MAQPIFAFLKKIADLFANIIPSCEVDIEKVKDDIWADLSALYYKYDDNSQKKAFREVTHEISTKLVEGKWDSIYKKLYHKENGAKNIRFHSLT